MDTFALADRLDALALELDTALRTEMETVAETGKSIVIQRVSETGIDADGHAFKPYTREYELRKRGAVGTAKKEGAKKRAERRTNPASTDKPIGRFRGIVDFTLTGRMLSNIGLVEEAGSGASLTLRVGGRSEETRLKMQGNNNYRPGWFRLAVKERVILAEQSAKRLGTFVRNFLLP